MTSKNYGRSLFAVATSTSNFYFTRHTGYFDGRAIEKPALHTWSLSVEEQFYAVLPPLLLVLYKLGRKHAVLAMATIAVASLWISSRDVGIRPHIAFFSTAERAWELFAGALLAFGVAPAASGRAVREAEAMLGVLLIAFGYFFYTGATEFPGLAALPFCIGAALTIHSGLGTPPTAVAKALSSPPVVGLGLISYSAYLWHWPLLVFSRYRFPQAFADGATHSIAGNLALATASIGLGAASWRFVDQPFRRTSTASVRIPVFMTAAAAIAAMVVLSCVVVNKPSWLQHWPANVVAMTSMSKDSLPAASFRRPMPTGSSWPRGTFEMGFGAGTTDTVLWGDSHAEALIPGFASYSKKSDQPVIVATHPGCPPLADVTFYGGRYSAPCRGLNKSTVTNALGAKIKRVVLASRWAVSAENLRRDSAGRAISIQRQSGANGEVFSAVLETTVRQLTEHGKEVVIIGPVPEQQFDVTPAIIRHIVWHDPLPQELNLASFLERQRGVLPVLARLSKLPNVRVVYPHLILCSGDACRYSKNGEPLYSDSNHLKALGAAELSSMIAEIFDPASSHYAAAP